jgi:hypothetical protein
MESLDKTGKAISKWDQPGGKLGMVVAGLLGAAGLMVLYKILPFLITLATNIITLSILCTIIGLIIWLVTDKNIRANVSAIYFIFMRKITGAIIEIDPIAIVMQRVMKMKKRIIQISEIMGQLKGLIRDSEDDLKATKCDLQDYVLQVQEYKEQGKRDAATVANNQVVRLEDDIKKQITAIKDSK